MSEESRAMIKSEVNAYMAEKLGVSKKQAGDFIEALAELATSQAREVGAFTIPGIGKLVLSQRAARKGRNPATGEPIDIPAKTVVKMRLFKACKDAILPPQG